MNTNERLRVLYVDDNCDSRQMVEVMLDLAQIDVECADSILEALRLSALERFDLYLLDCGLSDGSGLTLCRTFRSIDPKTPILFYSGSAHPEEIRKGINAGADGYITKPNSDRLAPIITQLVENRRAASLDSGSRPVIAFAA